MASFLSDQVVKNADLKETIKVSGIKQSIELLTLGLSKYRQSKLIKSSVYSAYQELDEVIEKLEDLDEQLTYLVERSITWGTIEDA